jgi:hypothetical protein
LHGATAEINAAAPPNSRPAKPALASGDALEGAWILGLSASVRRGQTPAADCLAPRAGLPQWLGPAGAATEIRTICDNCWPKTAISHRVREHLEPGPLGPAIYQGK